MLLSFFPFVYFFIIYFLFFFNFNYVNLSYKIKIRLYYIVSSDLKTYIIVHDTEGLPASALHSVCVYLYVFMCTCVRVFSVHGFPLTPRRYAHTHIHTSALARGYDGARTQTTNANTPTNPVARASPRMTGCPGRYSRTSIATWPDDHTGLVRCRVRLSDITFYRTVNYRVLATLSLSLPYISFQRTLHAPHHVPSIVDVQFANFFSVCQYKRFKSVHIFNDFNYLCNSITSRFFVPFSFNYPSFAHQLLLK